ncbi:hypothetical protein BDV10DRAFT_165260 [Aspergillus recurvatus]
MFEIENPGTSPVSAKQQRITINKNKTAICQGTFVDYSIISQVLYRAGRRRVPGFRPLENTSHVLAMALTGREVFIYHAILRESWSVK